MSESMAQLYLRECGGDEEAFVKRITDGVHIGKAFVLALHEKDRDLVNERWPNLMQMYDFAASALIDEIVNYLLDIPTTRKQ